MNENESTSISRLEVRQNGTYVNQVRGKIRRRECDGVGFGWIDRQIKLVTDIRSTSITSLEYQSKLLRLKLILKSIKPEPTLRSLLQSRLQNEIVSIYDYIILLCPIRIFSIIPLPSMQIACKTNRPPNCYIYYKFQLSSYR